MYTYRGLGESGTKNNNWKLGSPRKTYIRIRRTSVSHVFFVRRSRYCVIISIHDSGVISGSPDLNVGMVLVFENFELREIKRSSRRRRRRCG